MASRRASAIATQVLRHCKLPLAPRKISTARPTISIRAPPTTCLRESVRWHSAPATNSKVYDFGKVKTLIEQPSEDTILVDVREPAEYQAGFIPTAINIPISSQPDAMFLPEDEFEDRFGFSKPDMDKEVIFYCKAGVRSSAAAQLAQQHGYSNVAEYRGSWIDWNKNSGKVEHPR